MEEDLEQENVEQEALEQEEPLTEFPEEENLDPEPIEYDTKEPHLNDIFGLEDWDLYRAFAIENGYEIHEISPAITEQGSIRQFQVVEKTIHIPTHEEQRQARAEAYRLEKDPITCQIDSLRDEEQTPEVIAEIEKLKQQRSEVVSEIQERYPYPEGEE